MSETKRKNSPGSEEISQNIPLRVVNGIPPLLDVREHCRVSSRLQVGQVVQSLDRGFRKRRGGLLQRECREGQVKSQTANGGV